MRIITMNIWWRVLFKNENRLKRRSSFDFNIFYRQTGLLLDTFIFDCKMSTEFWQKRNFICIVFNIQSVPSLIIIEFEGYCLGVWIHFYMIPYRLETSRLKFFLGRLWSVPFTANWHYAIFNTFKNTFNFQEGSNYPSIPSIYILACIIPSL